MRATTKAIRPRRCVVALGRCLGVYSNGGVKVLRKVCHRPQQENKDDRAQKSLPHSNSIERVWLEVQPQNTFGPSFFATVLRQATQTSEFLFESVAASAQRLRLRPRQCEEHRARIDVDLRQ